MTMPRLDNEVRKAPTDIRVIGCGGGGTNAVNRMIEAGISGVTFIAMNTDQQVLDISLAPKKLQLGAIRTRGLGAGGDPEVGREAAEESKTEIREMLEGADMVFVTAGMGGGTGTGAAPVIADVARSLGILTVAVVTKPFTFEGPRRRRVAMEGIQKLEDKVDTVIVVPNDRLLSVGQREITLVEAFRLADEVLRQGVQGISDIVTIPGMINVDFADVCATMRGAGHALMGIGVGSGEKRAAIAAQEAISSPLLETPINGATRLLVNITSGPDLSLGEVDEAAQIITQNCDNELANVIFGWVCDEEMTGKLRITVLAAGFSALAASATPRSAATSAEAVHERNVEPLGQRPQPPRVEAKPSRPVTSEPLEYPQDEDLPPFLRPK